jgi:hypothetical protein
MPYLAAATVLLGLLGLLNLLLTIGIIKRLREHTDLLSTLTRKPAIGVGEEVGEFAASTVDGNPVDHSALAGDTLVGIFSTTCQPCRETVPKFVAYARTLPGGRERVLAAVVGTAEDAAGFVAELSPVARVVVEGPTGPVSAAFQVRAYPTVLRLRTGERGRPVVSPDPVALDQPAFA